MGDVDAVWRVRFEKGLRASRRADGTREFVSRKSEELFCRLAIAGRRGASRDELASQLWPEATRESGLHSLRQSLSDLRKVVPGTLADRERIWLGSTVVFKVESSATTAQPVKAPSVHDQKIEGLRQTLSWLAEDNPAQMFEIMRTSVDLVSGLRPGDIECILARAAPRLTLGHPYRGWELFWRAFSTETDWKGLNPGELHHMALQRALATKDEALASISVLCLGLILVARGKTKQATGIATNTLDFLSTKTKAQYRKRVSLVLGMGQIHSGRVREGITILESVSGCPDISSLEVAYDESNRAFYLASVGRNEHALEALEEPLRIARETQHYYLNQMNSFALAVAMLKSDPKSSAALMKRCIAESPCYGWEPISHETLAAAQHQLGDFDTARSELAAANRMRKARNLPYTEIDRIRLRPLAPYFSTIETTRVARPSPASRTPATL